jgi:hypothetical protein
MLSAMSFGMKLHYAQIGSHFVKIDTVADENYLSTRIACLTFLYNEEDLAYMTERFADNAAECRAGGDHAIALVFDALINACRMHLSDMAAITPKKEP